MKQNRSLEVLVRKKEIAFFEMWHYIYVVILISPLKECQNFRVIRLTVLVLISQVDIEFKKDVSVKLAFSESLQSCLFRCTH